jgi:hypothetical protein
MAKIVIVVGLVAVVALVALVRLSMREDDRRRVSAQRKGRR